MDDMIAAGIDPNAYTVLVKGLAQDGYSRGRLGQCAT